jgi:vancomycin resistance protein YoaR
MTLAFLQENTKRISSFTTRFPTSSSDEVVQNRVFNIKKATARINCYVVQPDEEWSFNDWVGPRTKETGWKEANGISGGKEYTLQAGGGICQVSTTLYNALLSGNIPVTDRTAHSIPSTYVDKGLDATVDTSGIDLKFKNDTGAPIYIFVYITPDSSSSRYLNITVSLYGKPLPEGVTYKPRSEVTETIPRHEIVYVDDAAIPVGYQLEKVKAHDGYKAKAYVDKYVNGKLEESIYLYEDKYRGNNAEVHIGTGDPLTVPFPKERRSSGRNANRKSGRYARCRYYAK